MPYYPRRPLRPRVQINIKNINVSTMSGSSSFNVGDFAVIDPVSSQDAYTTNANSNNNYSRTTTNQRGGAGAFNTGNNNKIVNPFNRIQDFGSNSNATT